MILSRRVAFMDSGSSDYLDQLDNSIAIQSVVPGVASKNVSSVTRMSGIGNRITEEKWDPLETTVSFGIDLPKRELQQRMEVFDKVVAWANRKGMIRISDKVNKYMYVEQATFDSGFDPWDWTREYEIKFKAYSIPFWQSNNISYTMAASDTPKQLHTATVNVPGNVRTVVDMGITNVSGVTINNMTVQVLTKERGSETGKIVLKGIGLPANGRVSIDHGNDGVLRIEKHVGDRDTAIMECVDSASTDDLFISAGDGRYISVTTERGCDMWCAFRGRYLS